MPAQKTPLPPRTLRQDVGQSPYMSLRRKNKNVVSPSAISPGPATPTTAIKTRAGPSSPASPSPGEDHRQQQQQQQKVRTVTNVELALIKTRNASLEKEIEVLRQQLAAVTVERDEARDLADELLGGLAVVSGAVTRLASGEEEEEEWETIAGDDEDGEDVLGDVVVLGDRFRRHTV